MVLAKNTGLVLVHRKRRKYKKVFKSIRRLSAYKQLVMNAPKLHTPISSWKYWAVINSRRRNWNDDRLTR